jgi:hypothetical protein
MKRILYVSFLFLLNATAVRSQTVAVEASLQKLIKGSFQFFQVDELGALYAYTSNGQLKKYNSNLDSLAVFNDIKRFGKLYSIHAENPLRTLLYFKDFTTVIALDRMMQPVQKIDLRKLNLFQVKAIAPSYDNKIWVYDEQNSKIKKINFEGSVEFESTDLRLVFDEKLSPTRLFESEGNLCLYDPRHGIYVFDYYGGFKKKITTPELTHLHTWMSSFVGFQDGNLHLLGNNVSDYRKYPLPTALKGAKQYLCSFNLLYKLGENGIEQYSFTINPSR